MNPSPVLRHDPDRGGRRILLLERATAVVLLIVLLMALAACRPEWCARVALNVQVWFVLALLTAALVLVSVVALLHTRS